MNNRILIVGLMNMCLLSADPVLADNKRDARKEKDQKFFKDLEAIEKDIRTIRQYAAQSRSVAAEVAILISKAEEFKQSAQTKYEAGETYVAGRLKGSSDNLVEAAEHLANARMNTELSKEGPRPPRREEDDEEDAAKALERAYFRTAQLDFFTRQKGAAHVHDLGSLSRRLYQEGRAAFDRKNFFVARQLAKASHELSEAIERYLQSQLSEELPLPPKVNRE
jgi:hypothetical protein